MNYILYNVDGSYQAYNKYKLNPVQSGNLNLDKNRIPFDTELTAGNFTSYYTPVDNPLMLKAIGDTIFYSQMFSYNLDIDLQGITYLPNWKIGDVIKVDFFTRDTDKWDSLNGGWLIKGFDYIFPGNTTKLRLARMGSGEGIGVLPQNGYVELK